ncbi:MAG: hypothetical protein SGPRY_006189 [Prymnesium sp.]
MHERQLVRAVLYPNSVSTPSMPPLTTPYVAVEEQKNSRPPHTVLLISLAAVAATLALTGSFAHPIPWSQPTVSASYDIGSVNWPSLRADLKAFVEKCECGPILVRLSWHDSGTFNSSDGTGGSHAEMRFPNGESTDGANAGLGIARGLLQPFKLKYPTVGYADLWALAATVAIESMGGPTIIFRAGRRDGAEAESVPHGRLPDGGLYASHLRWIFYRMGFDDRDIVALSGAHTIGKCHADRSGFDGPWTNDPLIFNSDYFQLLLNCDWTDSVVSQTGKAQLECLSAPGLVMLHTDYALVTDDDFKPFVELFAKDQSAFFKVFAAAFHRLQELGHANLKEVF